MKTDLTNPQKKSFIDLVYAKGENAVIHNISAEDKKVVQDILGEETEGEIHVFKYEDKVKMAHINCILNLENKEDEIFMISRDKEWEREEYKDYTPYKDL